MSREHLAAVRESGAIDAFCWVQAQQAQVSREHLAAVRESGATDAFCWVQAQQAQVSREHLAAVDLVAQLARNLREEDHALLKLSNHWYCQVQPQPSHPSASAHQTV